MWPEPLQLGIIPDDIKEQVINECLPYTKKGKVFSEVESFIKIIKNSAKTKLTWQDTKNFLTYYDSVRNLSAKEMCPMYKQIESNLQGAYSPL